MNHVLNNNKVSCFTQKHSAAILLPARQMIMFCPGPAITALTPLTVSLI